MGKAKRCSECRDGGHEDYDDNVVKCLVKNPDDGRVTKILLCGEHRCARRDDGYEVREME